MGEVGRSSQVLPGLPPLGRLIARAALTSFGRPSPDAGLPGREVVVLDHAQDLGRLADYDRVCGFALGDRVPGTWLHVLTFPLQAHLMADRTFPFPLAGLVHLRNEMTLHRAVAATDRLRLGVHVENLADHRRGYAFDLVGTVHVGDQLAWTGRSTYLARRPDARRPDARTPDARRPDHSAAGARHDAPSAAGTERGERAPLPAPSQLWTLPADLGRRYAAVSGDTNPLHLYPATARLFGFPRPIIHGMWTHARVLAALGGRLPETYTASVTFTKPILLPGRVTFGLADDGGFAVMNSDATKPYLVGRLA